MTCPKISQHISYQILITSYHIISNLFRRDLEPVKSPASKLEPTGLLVKWKVAHLTQKIKKST